MVGLPVTEKWMTFLRPWSRITKTYRMSKVSVGTVKKSIAHETSRWLRRNGSQVVDLSPEFPGSTMYLRIVSACGGS